MKKLTRLTIAVVMTFGLVACDSQDKKESADARSVEEVVTVLERPSDADLHAFKAYHHAVYMVTTAKEAGGTNKLIHTTSLPTEGTDAVVTPALDHIYTKAVLDLTSGPVVVEFPEVEKGRYYSIHITDQEHYTIYDEIHPVGNFVVVRKGKGMKAPEGATVIESPGDYPHLFIRIQVKTTEDLANVYPIQQKIKLIGVSKELTIDKPVEFTIATHDVYPQNKKFYDATVDFNEADYNRVSAWVGENAPTYAILGNYGKFDAVDSKEPHSNDPGNRAAAIIGHLGLPIHHAWYAPYFTNCSDEVLNGDKTEVFTFPYKPEGVKLFWSVTRYSAITRNTLAGKNDIYNMYNTKPDANGNITVTFSVDDPKDGTYWMPVNAGEPYYLIVRYYMPDADNLPKNLCK